MTQKKENENQQHGTPGDAKKQSSDAKTSTGQSAPGAIPTANKERDQREKAELWE